jgi:hypothetical protein
MTTVLICNPATMQHYFKDYVPTEHDKAVHQLICKTIDLYYTGTIAKRGGTKLATVVFILEKCQVPGATRVAADTTDTVSRDAEYYFKSRFMVAQDKHLYSRILEALWIDAKNVGYNALKAVCFSLGIQDSLKTDNNPISRPGGLYWGFQGASDGFNDDPDSLQRPANPALPARGLTLSAYPGQTV